MPSSISDSLAVSIEENTQTILSLSHQIHADPEFAYEEHHAAASIVGELGRHGFAVREGVYETPTAFEATAGSGPFRVVICAEYDAVPGLGHACGHNMVAAAAVGGALALAGCADELGLTVVVLGTPAEEHGYGKVRLLDRGAWDGATMSIMLHGIAGTEDVSCADVRSSTGARFDVTFAGTAAHSMASPDRAVNAGDAATVSLVAIGLLRQHLGTDIRIGAYVDHGGEATNVVPDLTIVRGEVWAPDPLQLQVAKSRMLACLEAGALATGCSWGFEDVDAEFEVLEQNPLLASIWDAELRNLGRHPVIGVPLVRGATGMGNVSRVVPSISPTITIRGATGALHSLRFADDAVSPAADEAILDGALAMARTVAAAASGQPRAALLG